MSIPPSQRARRVLINKDAVASREKASKLPTKGGKIIRKGNAHVVESLEASSNSEEVYETYLTSSNKEIKSQYT